MRSRVLGHGGVGRHHAGPDDPLGRRQHDGEVRVHRAGHDLDGAGGVTSINLEAAGGTGGNFGANLGTSGYGADITGTLAVTPGETLVLAVGGSGSTNKSNGGWGYDGMTGGPSNTANESDRSGGSGGGATFVGIQNGSTVTPLVIAGAGGGIAGGSADPLNVGAGGSAGCAAIQNNFEQAGKYKCLTPTLAGMNGGDGTIGPLGGKGGKAGGSATGAGQRGGGASELGGNGGSGGGGLKGGAAGTGAKGVSAGWRRRHLVVRHHHDHQRLRQHHAGQRRHLGHADRGRPHHHLPGQLNRTRRGTHGPAGRNNNAQSDRGYAVRRVHGDAS